MSLPRYREYKDSGVTWLGEVPAHWTVASLKRGFSVCLGKMLQTESGCSDDILRPYLRAANIQWGGIDVSDVKLMWFSPRALEQLRLINGDLLVSEGGDVGRSAIWRDEIEECYIQNSVNRLRGTDGNSTAFLYYWMVTIKAKGYVDVLCNKSTIAHFTAEKVAEVPTPFPPSAEQTIIATFLDRETGKIDALIAEQEKLISLLAEKRQATIAHAVACGLNPDAPMKDSGVSWLGEVPAHWTVSALSYLASIESGATPGRGDPRYWNGSIPWIKTGEINWAPICYAEESISELALVNSAVKVAKPGTLLMAMYGQGATRGRVALLTIEATYNQACAAISFGFRISPDFGRYFFMAAYEHVRDSGNETSQMNLSTGVIAKIKLSVPPLKEQADIVRFLDAETAKLDSLRTEAEIGIALLKERRIALIAAAVTGQIDVHGVATSKPIPAKAIAA